MLRIGRGTPSGLRDPTLPGRAPCRRVSAQPWSIATGATATEKPVGANRTRETSFAFVGVAEQWRKVIEKETDGTLVDTRPEGPTAFSKQLLIEDVPQSFSSSAVDY